MNMTLMRRRVRVSKYIILVNHIGTKMGTKFLYLHFIDIKQLLKASKWRRDRDSNPGNLAVQRFSRPPHSTTLPPLRAIKRDRSVGD